MLLIINLILFFRESVKCGDIIYKLIEVVQYEKLEKIGGKRELRVTLWVNIKTTTKPIELIRSRIFYFCNVSVQGNHFKEKSTSLFYNKDPINQSLPLF